MGRCWGIITNLRRCRRKGDWLLFCHDHKRQWLIWVSFLVFTVGGGLASIVSYYDKRQSSPIPGEASEPKPRAQPGGRQPLERETVDHGSTSQLALHFKNVGCNSLLELDSASALVSFKKSIEYDKNSDFLNWVISYIEEHNESLLPSLKTEAWLELYRDILTKHGAELDTIIRNRFIEAIGTKSR